MTNAELHIEDTDEPTLEDHPGLDNEEATAAGRMMTASGSIGPAGGKGDYYEADDFGSTAETEHRQEITQPSTDPGRRRSAREDR